MMGRMTFHKFLCAMLLPVTLWATAGHGGTHERGVAITDPLTLRELDGDKLNLGRLLGAGPDASGAALFALPSMVSARAAIGRELDRYASNHAAALAVPSGSGALARLQLLDRAPLYANSTRFMLAGIVNRMDRAYVSPQTCGEIRLIYRPVANGGTAEPTRMPMTLNLVMKARAERSVQTDSCSGTAGRWLASADLPLTGAELAAKMTAQGGSLEPMTPQHIGRIEINIQVARLSPNADDFDARADYLMMVFRYDPQQERFEESPLENQIDRDRIIGDAKLAVDFRQWLFEPKNLEALDRGTVVIPPQFLAMSAINRMPSSLEGDHGARGLVADRDVAAALANAAGAGIAFENILSPTGVMRRLNDITCTGCHQTRAIGGFHFPGVDASGKAAPGAIIAPASPHFFGDQERRRDILAAFRDGRPPDFARGFSARPQPRRSKELAGTTYVNGWGAICYPAGTNAAPDSSFASWTCAEGLTCQAAPGASSSRAGFCFPKNN